MCERSVVAGSFSAGDRVCAPIAVGARRCRPYLSGRVRGISNFEMRKLEIGECEGENVRMWRWVERFE